MGIVFKNNAKTTLSSAVNNSTTTIPVTEGSVFPAVNLSGAGTFFLLTLDDETNNEILKVTSCSGASGNIDLTVIRAQESTTARAFSSGDKAELRFTSGTVDEIRSDNTVHTNIFTTSNNSTTAFTLSDEVANENDLVVFIDGVFQAHNTFSVSGTTLTLATAPASGRVVTVYSIKGSRSASNVALATMTGDNSDTTLTLPVEPINENSVQVFFDGVYQNKDSFSISGTTLTFGVAPPTGVAVEALVFTKLAINTSSILSDTDADTKVQVEESSDEDKIRFDTGGTERMVLDSNVLQVNTSSVANLSIGNSSDVMEVKAKKDGTDDVDLAFHTQASGGTTGEVMRISSDGKVGIGNTSPTTALDVLASTNSTNSAVYPVVTIQNTAANSDNSYAGLNVKGGNGQVNGFILADGRSSANVFSIRTETATPIQFNTNGSERMRIDSDGNLLLGTTTRINNSNTIAKTTDHVPLNIRRDNGASDNSILICIQGTNTAKMAVRGDGDLENVNNSYGALSDERLKSNIVDANSQLEDIKKVKVRNYTLDSTGETHIGVIAQELEAEGMNGLVVEREEGYKGVKYSILFMKAIKAIQEQQTIIDDLKSRIETLEG